MGCSSSRADDDAFVALARRSQDNNATWFTVADKADASHPESFTDISTSEDDHPTEDAEEHSLLRARTLLQVRMCLDETGGVFDFAERELESLARAVAELSDGDGDAVSPRTSIRRWYESEALAAASARSSSSEFSRPRAPTSTSLDAGSDSILPPVPTPQLVRRSSNDEPRAAPPPRASFEEQPIEEVAERALATLRELVSATGGHFTEATIPPRLLARLHYDVVRVREEMENRVPEKYASKSTAGKRRAIERWYNEHA